MSKVVLVLGSGGREHALAKSLMGSSSKVVVAPGNAGTATTKGVTNLQLNIKDQQEVSSWCKNNNVNVVVVGPEDPLAEGLADHLQTQGIKVFGPCKAAAQIESSKAWAKDFMKRHEIPTADYSTFHSAEEAKKFINSKSSWSGWVVKASGLAAGKGVVVATTTETALAAVDTVAGSFGAAGDTIVVEEMLTGEEVSVLCFSDGESIAVMPPAQDHKRLEEGDKGPNTGGMGAYCPCPLISQSDIQNVTTNILQKTILGLKQEGNPFVGVLYAGLMLTPSGPSVLEFNCRFGDPETQVILPLLQTPLLDIVMACVEGRLSQTSVEFNKSLSCVAVCLVSGGYPGSYPKGKIIAGLDEASNIPHVSIYHAGTKLEGENIVTSGGRVLAVTVTDETLSSAAAKATSVSSSITFEGVFYRKDISAKARLSRECRLTYASSGVDIVAGDALVAAIKGAASATNRSGVLGDLGSFGGVFDVKAAGFKDPLLISGTDGVGTKLKVAQASNIHGTIGQDLVAMCVNDILCHGAEPLFFLDYFATGKLNVDTAAEVITGVAKGCTLAGCSLIGGETAEMPGLYSKGEYDLAGFSVGAVERDALLPRKGDMKEGDVLLGLPSSGLHSNGFSLVRRIVESDGLSYQDPAPFCNEKSLGEALLEPTKIYAKSVLSAIKSGYVKALAHITGGGITENLPRILPNGLGAKVDALSWTVHPVFHWIASHGVAVEEMSRTFNLGLGLVLAVDKVNVEKVKSLITDEKVFEIGTLIVQKEGHNQIDIENLATVIENGVKQMTTTHLSKSFLPVRRRVAVLISGSGTNLQALLDHCQRGLSAAEIVLVISNVSDVQGLQRAHKAGVNTKVIPHKLYKKREEFEDAIQKELEEENVEFVCLAGFMRILTASFVKKWNGCLLNIHPSLLPAFKGMHAQKQALEAGVAITGCSVHFVNEEVDGGAIVAQEAVQVFPNDSEDLLVERIKQAEHKAYPRALEMVARGKVKLNKDGTCIRL